MKNITADFFNEYSDKFDSIYGNNNSGFMKFINHHFRKTMRQRLELTLESCKDIKGKTALDVGCGPGHYCIALAKMGAKEVTGIDFAPKMIEIASSYAKKAGVESICKFSVCDFFEMDNEVKFDFLIFMGFMDYIKDPESLISKAIQITEKKLMFSFPSSSGFLAWQRQIRYKFKCPLYLYNYKQIQSLFSNYKDCKVVIKQLSRDYFVTVEKV